jgi:hypothetical protein
MQLCAFTSSWHLLWPFLYDDSQMARTGIRPGPPSGDDDGIVIILDVAVLVPLFERSYTMFRSFIGTWMPFVAIFLASWAVGGRVPAQ